MRIWRKSENAGEEGERKSLTGWNGGGREIKRGGDKERERENYGKSCLSLTNRTRYKQTLWNIQNTYFALFHFKFADCFHCIQFFVLFAKLSHMKFLSILNQMRSILIKNLNRRSSNLRVFRSLLSRLLNENSKSCEKCDFCCCCYYLFHLIQIVMNFHLKRVICPCPCM